jgi:hypothetical protein
MRTGNILMLIKYDIELGHLARTVAIIHPDGRSTSGSNCCIIPFKELNLRRSSLITFLILFFYNYWTILQSDMNS